MQTEVLGDNEEMNKSINEHTEKKPSAAMVKGPCTLLLSQSRAKGRQVKVVVGNS